MYQENQDVLVLRVFRMARLVTCKGNRNLTHDDTAPNSALK